MEKIKECIKLILYIYKYIIFYYKYKIIRRIQKILTYKKAIARDIKIS
jgi:hypothetical protein